ncbi:CRM1 C terminal-domain-containing protein [Phakopsora pachyrhizi]|uniref:CRM1 C terminal-domain-containing protein n=1 Tax=Phakopsora pachyrhizi TaxID=170000 RepID=A0AAV0BV79_PHAPC
MEELLNPTADPNLIDQVVETAFDARAPQQKQAMTILAQFQEQPDSWQKVPYILENSTSKAKYIALQIMEKLITTKWKALPEQQRSGIKNFIVGYIVKMTRDEAMMRKDKGFVNKMNLILVQILKQEWPHNWPGFIPEIISSSRTSLSLCENNMVILKLLSEEIFDYSAEQMTQAKTKALKNQMCNEFSDVFQLCNEILEKATKPSLISATLHTLLRFLNWIPLGYIFETSLIDHLINRYLEERQYRNITLRCLAEIGCIRDAGSEYDSKFILLLTMVMSSVNRILPPNTDLKQMWESQPQYEQEFVMALAVFLCSFLFKNARLLEVPQHQELMHNVHMYLIKISQVDDRELFKVCLEYWSKLVKELYDEQQSIPTDMGPLMGIGLNLGASGVSGNHFGGAGGAEMNGRKLLYREVCTNLRIVFIEKMVKPEEVLVVENDEGEVVREFLKETDTIVLYKAMREVLVYLTHLDVPDTEDIMLSKLARQVDGSEWSWNNCNTLCWAIGSISGAMNEESEKRFLVTVIKDLLGLTELKRGKDNKAIVASDIMYIVGQYPRFLKAHWKFLKTVVNKLFEFMHETHEGVQDMACDTFIKIAQKCRRHFITQQVGEQEPFVDEIIRNLDKITDDLSPQQAILPDALLMTLSIKVHTFYEAVGHMIAAQPNRPVQERLIAGLMRTPNTVWDQMMQQSAASVDVLASPDNIKLLSNVLKCNVSACLSIGPFFQPQIVKIYMDMLGLYKAVSGIISETVMVEGIIATKTPKVRGLRTIKKEILKLVDTHIRRAEDLNNLNDTLLPPLLEAVLGDYNRNIPAARDAEVLNVVSTIVVKLGPLLTNKVAAILELVFEPTLTMINQDFSEFPEHRVGFFKLLRGINAGCFTALLALEPARFKLMMDSVIWAIKHITRDIADVGLAILLELFSNISAHTDPPTAAAFFQQYYLGILQDIFFVLTDADHKSGFKGQSQVLSRMWGLVETGSIAGPLFNPAEHEAGMDNARFLKEYTLNLLSSAFPHVQPMIIQQFITGCSETYPDATRFKGNLRDFLIQLREYSGTSDGNNQDLFQEDKEALAEAKAQEQAAVPGMIKPSELKDEDEEIL